MAGIAKRIDFPPLQDLTFQLALQHDRSAYDSAYVALAQYLGVWLFTADRRLFNAVGSALDYVKWIRDDQFEAIPDAEDAEAPPLCYTQHSHERRRLCP